MIALFLFDKLRGSRENSRNIYRIEKYLSYVIGKAMHVCGNDYSQLLWEIHEKIFLKPLVIMEVNEFL